MEIHNPHFYWTILIANKELNSKISLVMGWWTPMFMTAGLTSATQFLKHFSRQNTLTKARGTFHVTMTLVLDLLYHLIFLQSNDLFALFLDDTTSYSTVVFKVTMRFPHSFFFCSYVILLRI
ncbi:unnamed protein product [Brassica oleracea var. botrytis]